MAPPKIKSERKAQGGSSLTIYRPKRRQRIVSVDLDDTVADVTRRREYALRFGEDCSIEFYSVFLDGQHYHMDTPIKSSVDFLWRYVREIKGKIVYLSGRRKGTEDQTESWLRKHGFPNGQIIHREMGHRSVYFKSDWIRTLRETYWIDAHFGDRLEDDEKAARYNGIKFIHIRDRMWPNVDDLIARFSTR
jgi:predicted secreted acid phosphatase